LWSKKRGKKPQSDPVRNGKVGRRKKGVRGMLKGKLIEGKILGRGFKNRVQSERKVDRPCHSSSGETNLDTHRVGEKGAEWLGEKRNKRKTININMKKKIPNHKHLNPHFYRK